MNVELTGVLAPSQTFQTKGARKVMLGPFNKTSQNIQSTTAAIPGNIKFDLRPNDDSQVFDRDMWVRYQFTVRYTFSNPTGNAWDGLANNQWAFNPKQQATDCLRAFPMSQMMNDISAQINGFKISGNPVDFLPVMPWIGTDQENYSSASWSSCPTAPDTKQAFDLYNYNLTTANTLFPQYASFATDPFYGNGAYVGKGHQSRKGASQVLSINYSTDPNTPNGAWNGQQMAANSVAYVFVEYVVMEPILLPPFMCPPNQPGLVGITDFQLSLGFQNVSRLVNRKMYCDGAVWSNGADVVLSDIVVGIQPSGATLFYTTYTPNTQIAIPRVTTYDVVSIQKFETPLSEFGSGVAFNNKTTNNIVTGIIPKRIYVWVGRSSAYWTNNRKPWYSTDTMAIISKCTVTYGSETYCPTYTTRDFYADAVKYGCNMTFPQFAQDVGSLLVFTIGDNIPLRQLNEAPGVLQNNNFSVMVSGTLPDNFDGTAPYTTTQTGDWSIYILTVTPNTLMVSNGKANLTGSQIDATDVGIALRTAAAKASEDVPIENLMTSNLFGSGLEFYGGGFGKMLKKAGSQALKYGLKQGVKFVNQHKGTIGKVARNAVRTAAHVGLGLAGFGGSMAGGSMHGHDDDDDDDADDEYEEMQGGAIDNRKRLRLEMQKY